MAEGDRPTILVVDDDQDLLLLAKESLLDFHVLVAGGGREAIDLLVSAQGRSIRALVLDLMMPNVDGFAVLRELRARPETASMPVIVLTARQDLSVEQQADEMGADAFLTKPYNPQMLEMQLRMLIDATPAIDLDADQAIALDALHDLAEDDGGP